MPTPNKAMAEYERRLKTLVAILARPHTARELADRSFCCPPTIYQMIKALKRRGIPVKSKKVEKDPSATGYDPSLFWVDTADLGEARRNLDRRIYEFSNPQKFPPKTLR